jgi:hypothetical protein
MPVEIRGSLPVRGRDIAPGFVPSQQVDFLRKGPGFRAFRLLGTVPWSNEHEHVSCSEDISHVLAPSKGLSKLIPIDEEPNHQIVHALRF